MYLQLRKKSKRRLETSWYFLICLLMLLLKGESLCREDRELLAQYLKLLFGLLDMLGGGEFRPDLLTGQTREVVV